jgi:hypothetical protein
VYSTEQALEREAIEDKLRRSEARKLEEGDPT